jgi:hypothetical protein
MKTQQIAAALQNRIDEYELIKGVVTDNPEADTAFNRAMDIALCDLRELLADISHSLSGNVAIVRHLHVVN